MLLRTADQAHAGLQSAIRRAEGDRGKHKSFYNTEGMSEPQQLRSFTQQKQFASGRLLELTETVSSLMKPDKLPVWYLMKNQLPFGTYVLDLLEL